MPVMSRPLNLIVPRVGGSEQIEAGGLAGAVGPDQGVDGAGPDLQRHLIHGEEAAELTGQAECFQDDVAQPGTSPSAKIDLCDRVICIKAAGAQGGGAIDFVLTVGRPDRRGRPSAPLSKP